jgi:hypothetical protein
MTKNEIICLLRNLRPAQIKDIAIVYHNPNRGFLFMDLGSVLNEFARFQFTLYRNRRDIKYVSVTYTDDDGISLSNIYFDEKFPVSLSLYSYLKRKNK